MFSVTVAGEGEDDVAQVSAVLRGRRFRVETLQERRARARRNPSDGLVVVSASADHLRTTRVVLDARRDEDVRFLPFALVARALERSAAAAFGAKACIRFEGSPEDLVTEVRRMLLREQEKAVLVHQLEGELGDLGVSDVLDTLSRDKRDAVVRVSAGAARGALRVRRGTVISATFDSRTGRDALSAVLALRTGRFRVELRTIDDTDELGALDIDTARAVLERVDAPRDAGLSDVRAPIAALAAAVMNAVTGYARMHLPEGVVARELEAAQQTAAKLAPSLSGFRVHPAGMITVVRLEAVAEGSGRALGLWVRHALERLELLRPGRFGAVRVHDIVGGLARMIDQVGFRADFDAAIGGTS